MLTFAKSDSRKALLETCLLPPCDPSIALQRSWLPAERACGSNVAATMFLYTIPTFFQTGALCFPRHETRETLHALLSVRSLATVGCRICGVPSCARKQLPDDRAHNRRIDFLSKPAVTSPMSSPLSCHQAIPIPSFPAPRGAPCLAHGLGPSRFGRPVTAFLDTFGSPIHTNDIPFP
jgi:hypothetical protein